MAEVKAALHAKLRDARSAVLASLDGLSEYDVRRPMTASGTNLLGLVKHLIGVEQLYFGEAFGRTSPTVLPWYADGSVWDGADMWAAETESREYLLGLYAGACAHADRTIAELALDTPGVVQHWPEERRATTLGVLLIRMLEETAHHAGHADICRELIDGTGPPDRDEIGDAAYWNAYVARIQQAADTFASAD